MKICIASFLDFLFHCIDCYRRRSPNDCKQMFVSFRNFIACAAISFDGERRGRLRPSLARRLSAAAATDAAIFGISMSCGQFDWPRSTSEVYSVRPNTHFPFKSVRRISACDEKSVSDIFPKLFAENKSAADPSTTEIASAISCVDVHNEIFPFRH